MKLYGTFRLFKKFRNFMELDNWYDGKKKTYGISNHLSDSK